jgi:integrase
MGVTIRKKHDMWYVFINHMGKRKSKCIGTDHRAAEQVKRVMEAKLSLGDLGILAVEKNSMPTFEDYSKQWLDHYARLECKTSTHRSYEQLLRLHVTPRFGKKRLNEITRESVKQFASDLSRQRMVDKKTGADQSRFSRNSLRLILNALRSVLNAAVEDGLIHANPATKVGRFAKSEKPTHKASAMTRREAERFLEAVQEVCPDWYPFFLTALRAGLRRGELIALKWGDIQFGASENASDRYIFVQQNWVLNEFTSPKSRESRRVDLSRQLRRVLFSLYDRRFAAAQAEGHMSIADDLVFPSQAGTPQTPDNIAVRYMQPALTKAGLRKFRLHDLRHTFGSLLIQDGASLAYVKEQMGHSSIQITVDTYGHLVPGADISWIDRLDGNERTHVNAPPAHPDEVDNEENSSQVVGIIWLPPRDSNPDMLIQSQLSYH